MIEGYEFIKSWCTPAYSYIEGDDHEHHWADSQNCYYHVYLDETDEETGLRPDGKKYWIIEPLKPVGVTITNENYKEVMKQLKWVVTISSETYPEMKEWDFDNHCVKL